MAYETKYLTERDIYCIAKYFQSCSDLRNDIPGQWCDSCKYRDDCFADKTFKSFYQARLHLMQEARVDLGFFVNTDMFKDIPERIEGSIKQLQEAMQTMHQSRSTV